MLWKRNSFSWDVQRAPWEVERRRVIVNQENEGVFDCTNDNGGAASKAIPGVFVLKNVKCMLYGSNKARFVAKVGLVFWVNSYHHPMPER